MIALDRLYRRLTAATCARLPIIAGDADHGLTAATVAVEADGAALVVVMDRASAAARGLRRGLRGRGGEGLAGEARRYRHGHRRDTDRGSLLRGSSALIILYPAHSGSGYCDRAYHLQLEGRLRG